MKESISKEAVNKDLERAERAVAGLKFKVENPDDLKNILEEDVAMLKERVEMVQNRIDLYKDKINALPESTEEEKQIEELNDIGSMLSVFADSTEAKLKQYFNVSILDLEIPSQAEQQIQKKNSNDKPSESIEPAIEKENKLNENEINESVIGPLELLGKGRKYIDEKGNKKEVPDKYYVENIKKLDLKKLDLAISDPEFRFTVMQQINSYFEKIKNDQNYIQKKLTRELGKLLAGHAGDLISEKYKEINSDDEEKDEQGQEQEVVFSLANNLVLKGDLDFKSKKELENVILNNADKIILEKELDNYGHISPELIMAVSIIEKNKDSEAFIALENLINNSFLENNYKKIQQLAVCSKIGKEKLNDYLLEKFKIPLSGFGDSWNLNKEQKHFTDISGNLKAMQKIEDAGAGNVKKLFENYGIQEFQRYPAEMLIAQIEEEDANQPYGLVVYPREDYNDAFDSNLDTFKKLFKDTRGHFGLKVYEVSNKRDLAKAFIKSEQKYSKENKISFMILGGHGHEETISLGPDSKKRDGLSVSNVGSSIDVGDLEGSGVKNASRFFEKDPTIVLVSCSTGAEGGIGQKISEQYGAKVIAPEKPTALNRILTSYDKEGKISFKVSYQDNAEKVYLAGEKIK